MRLGKKSRAQSPRVAVKSVAGLLDVGSASLASFAVGIYATGSLDPERLGAYALMFSAIIFASTIPTRLIFLPMMAESVKSPPSQRLAYFAQGIRLGAIPLVVAAGGVFLVGVALPGDLPANERIWLASTAGLAGLIHSLQLFGRQLLHYAERSWRAAGVSGARLAVVIAALGILGGLPIPAVAVPLAALALGNLAGAAISASIRRSHRFRRTLSARLLLSRGRLLLGAAALPQGATFVASHLVLTLAGASYLGYAEAARIVAQPILVIAMASAAITNPQIMEAASYANALRARRSRLLFLGVLTLGALAYAGFALLEWSGNFMFRLVPVAYEIVGLVPLTLLAVFVSSTAMPFSTHLVGAGKEQSLLLREIPASLIQVAFGLTAPISLAFARPLGSLVGGVIRTSLLAMKTMATMRSKAFEIPEDTIVRNAGQAPSETEA